MKTKNIFAASLLASLSFSCTAFAQSSVKLYGLIGVYGGTIKASGDHDSDRSLESGGLTTSFWGLRGEEKLGNGYSVFFKMESFFRPTTGEHGRWASDPFWSRNALLGVATPLGELSVGRQTNPTYTNMVLLNPFRASTVFSPVVRHSFVTASDGAFMGGTVWDSALQYTTPTINGFKGTVVYTAGDGIGDDSGSGNIGLHAEYRNGPFTAAASLQRVKAHVQSPITRQDGYLAGFTYDFDHFELFLATAGTKTYGIERESKTYEIGASIPVANSSTILLEWSRLSIKNKNNLTRNTGSLGYDYKLSPRTNVYGVYMYDKREDMGSGNTLAVGIRHTF